MATPAVTRAVVAMLARSDRTARLAMRGVSMLPLLRAPMVLDLRPFDRSRARVGEILVFERGQDLVAHRIVALAPQLQTCGDALPWYPESPSDEAIVGIVTAVWSDDSPSARRMDNTLFRWHGTMLARFRRSRALWVRARAALARRVAAVLRPHSASQADRPTGGSALQ